MKLIDNARQWWRLWSVRLNAAGLAILAWVQFDPVGAMMAWNFMPREVRAILPPNFITIVGMILFALSMMARLLVQPKLRKDC